MNAKKGVIVVTGCSGRVGLHFAEKMGRDYQIVGFDVVPPSRSQDLIDYFSIDLSSDESVQKGFNEVSKKYGTKLVSVLHLAAYYSFSKGAPEMYEKITVQGTRRILENLQRFQCEQFIFSSTQLVHKMCPLGQKVNEDSPLDPKWDYPKSKVETEALIHAKHGKIPAVILRIAGCYDDECHSIPIANQIQRIYEKQFAARVFPGDVRHGQPFLHFDDLISSIQLSIERRRELPQELTLLIGEGVTYNYDQLQRAISRLLFSREMKTVWVPQWFAKLGAWAQNHTPFMPKVFVKPWMIDLADDNCALDISRAQATIGWEPRKTLMGTLPKMIAFLEADPLVFYKTNNLIAPRWLAKRENT